MILSKKTDDTFLRMPKKLAEYLITPQGRLSGRARAIYDILCLRSFGFPKQQKKSNLTVKTNQSYIASLLAIDRSDVNKILHSELIKKGYVKKVNQDTYEVCLNVGENTTVVKTPQCQNDQQNSGENTSKMLAEVPHNKETRKTKEGDFDISV